MMDTKKYKSLFGILSLVFLLIITIASLILLIWTFRSDRHSLLGPPPPPRITVNRSGNFTGTLQSFGETKLLVQGKKKIREFSITSFTQFFEVTKLQTTDLKNGFSVFISENNQRYDVQVLNEAQYPSYHPSAEEDQPDNLVFGTLLQCSTSECTVVNNNNKQATLKFNQIGKITTEKRIHRADIKEGAIVRVGYTGNKDNFRATQIELMK